MIEFDHEETNSIKSDTIYIYKKKQKQTKQNKKQKLMYPLVLLKERC